MALILDVILLKSDEVIQTGELQDMFSFCWVQYRLPWSLAFSSQSSAALVHPVINRNTPVLSQPDFELCAEPLVFLNLVTLTSALGNKS